MIRPETLSPSWPQKPLGDVVEFLDHLRRPITAGDRVPGPYPYYGANGQQDSVADYIFNEPLILMAEDGGYFGDPNRAIAYRVSGKFWVNNHAHVLRAKSGVDIGFLCRQLEKYDVTRFINGATRQKLNKSSAEKIPITLPPLPEQKRIAAILDKADAIRRKRQQAIKLADEFLRSVFLDMFGDPVTNPKGWPLGTIRELVSDVKYGTSKKAKESTGEYPILRMNNISYEGNLDLTNLKYIDLNENEKEKYFVHKGDLLFNRTNSKELVGKTAVYDRDTPMAFAGYLIRVRSNRNSNPYYLSSYLNSKHGKATLQSMCKNIIGMANINAQEFQDIKVLISPIELQSKYSEMVKWVRKKKARLLLALDNCSELMGVLNQRAFRGEL